MTEPTHSPVRIARARNGDLVVFAASGVLIATWMSRLPDIKEMLGLTPGGLGLLILALSVGAIVGLPSAGRLARRLGSRITVRLGAGLALAGVLAATAGAELFGSIPAAMAGLFVCGLGMGVWDVNQNLEGSIIEQALGRAIMPWFHAAFSGATVAAALLGALMTWQAVPLGAHVVGVVAVSGIAVWWGTARFLPGIDDAAHEAHERPARERSAWLEPRTLLIGVLVLAAAFAEGTANDWMAVAFVDGHGTSKAMGVVALAVFLTFMTAGRIVGTTALDRFGRVVVLRILFVASVLGCALVVLGSTPLAYVGAAIWGAGASLGFPVGMSAASDDPARAALRLSVVSTIGYLAFLGGPVLIGLLGDAFGVLAALLAVGAVSLLAIALTPSARPLDSSARG